MESTLLQQPEQQSDDAVSTPQPRRTLKLVLTLQPRADAHYRALIALGADGCDPVLHTLDGHDLPAMLAAIPDLVAQAEAHWAIHPRYPTIPTPPKAPGKPTPAKAVTKETLASVDNGQPPYPPPPPPVLDTELPVDPSSAGQLTLFG